MRHCTFCTAKSTMAIAASGLNECPIGSHNYDIRFKYSPGTGLRGYSRHSAKHTNIACESINSDYLHTRHGSDSAAYKTMAGQTARRFTSVLSLAGTCKPCDISIMKDRFTCPITTCSLGIELPWDAGRRQVTRREKET